ncbi:MAG TPA: hypothetical protein VJA17_04290 [Candidatus Omnitrophota bacterium]|nr:hypothetical protein [Candidatus Omnitrophota bacterium]
MSPYTATAEVFMTAFRAMPSREQNIFLTTLIRDNSFREDILDLAVAVKRSREKVAPMRDFLKSIRNLPA